jgi:hypothetical protein
MISNLGNQNDAPARKKSVKISRLKSELTGSKRPIWRHFRARTIELADHLSPAVEYSGADVLQRIWNFGKTVVRGRETSSGYNTKMLLSQVAVLE